MSSEERDTTLRDWERSDSNSILPNLGENMPVDSRSVVVRMADGTRKAAVSLPGTLTIGQLIQTTQQKWNLPSTTNYAVRLERTGEQLDASASLNAAEIQAEDVLVVFPILEAGQK